mmetsp:Transcript_7827/g.22516  ORF Transcript_7827/g.22516 Transcript_7827/m.22516 type:complete len:249 (+) Transcript_7827:202-948(+)
MSLGVSFAVGGPKAMRSPSEVRSARASVGCRGALSCCGACGEGTAATAAPVWATACAAVCAMGAAPAGTVMPALYSGKSMARMFSRAASDCSRKCEARCEKLMVASSRSFSSMLARYPSFSLFLPPPALSSSSPIFMVPRSVCVRWKLSVSDAVSPTLAVLKATGAPAAAGVASVDAAARSSALVSARDILILSTCFLISVSISESARPSWRSRTARFSTRATRSTWGFAAYLMAKTMSLGCGGDAVW